jgi:hypothetical protein
MSRYSLFRRFVSLMLAVLVLTASVGLTVQRHTCRMSGRSKVDVTVPGRAPLRGCNNELVKAKTSALFGGVGAGNDLAPATAGVAPFWR